MSDQILSESIKKHAKQAFESHPRRHQTLESYLRRLDDPASSAALPVHIDEGHPLSHYFISSSHNTYLSGNQLWGRSTTDAYKDVLERGCRCIEVDLWDGGSPSSSEAEDEGSGEDRDVKNLSGLLKKGIGRFRARSNAKKPDSQGAPAAGDSAMPTPWRTNSGRDEPVVYHGYTATKEIPFRKVCEVVRDYAFKNTELPLIVSLEVHCHAPQQEIAAELMHDYWGSYLVRKPPDFSDATPLPLLASLRKKILVKVKWSPPEKAKAEPQKSPQIGPNSDDADSPGEEPAEATKKGKMAEELSGMGVYTRAFHFHSFDQLEAQIPTHVFSLSENKLLDVCKSQPKDVFQHNLHYLMRAYPKGSRVRSSNLEVASLWRTGLQLVALNFQKLNASTMLNFAQFDGSGGYVLKPKGYLPEEDQPLPDRETLDMTIKILAAQALGSTHDTPNAYVKCELHVESKDEVETGQLPNGGKNKGGEWKRITAVHHSRDPDFGGEELHFRGVKQVIPELSFMRIKVMDDALMSTQDRLLGWACYRLDRLPKGLLLIHLRGQDYKTTESRLLLDVQVIAADQIVSGGSSCT